MRREDGEKQPKSEACALLAGFARATRKERPGLFRRSGKARGRFLSDFGEFSPKTGVFPAKPPSAWTGLGRCMRAARMPRKPPTRRAGLARRPTEGGPAWDEGARARADPGSAERRRPAGEKSPKSESAGALSRCGGSESPGRRSRIVVGRAICVVLSSDFDDFSPKTGSLSAEPGSAQAGPLRRAGRASSDGQKGP